MARGNLLGFFLMTALFCGLFITLPDLATQAKGWIVPLLMGVMLSMGLTLGWNEFREVSRQPQVLVAGVAAQFLLMPLWAWLLSKGLALPEAMAIGLILVGASPGGTASNLVTFLAGGNTALSVTLTAFSTLLSPILTPLLIQLYLSQSIELDTADMILTLFKIILVPVFLGIILARLFRLDASKSARIATPAAMAAIALIIGIIAGLNAGNPALLVLGLAVAVILHNLLGLASGYLLGRVMGCDAATCRTLSIEIGMQNSGLAVVLALKYFSPISAAAGAIFSLWHNLSGMGFAYLAGKKRMRP